MARAQQRAAEDAREAARRAEEIDSYCMSEPEEQEKDDYSDDEDAANARAAKHVPIWAGRDAVRKALRVQADEKVDPDTIFFECNTCNLEEIFPAPVHAVRDCTLLALLLKLLSLGL